MSEVMSWSEIEASYPDEWVLILEPDTGPDLKVRSGMVAAHSKDRREVHKKAREIRPKRSAILFLGPPIAEDDCAIL
jgi:hypothetical protein